ncbi:MAG: hypothetical protein F6K21_10785 [Symploca sp. SIO2D2]|nr:hypothetical protein [Symploca sp. SIO2D2]
MKIRVVATSIAVGFAWAIANSQPVKAFTISSETANLTSIFTNPSLFDSSTVIDFEPGSSGNNTTAINSYLNSLGIGATLSIGGAGARIDDLSDSDRAPIFGASNGADGGSVSGVWGFEGGVLGESFLSLTFAAGHLPEAVGTFWGGVLSRNARMVATFEDGSTLTAFVTDFLPSVPNSAIDTAGINGFLGIDGQGQLIEEVIFFNNNDLYSQDNLTFGSVNSHFSSVAEPASTLGLLTLGVLGAGSTVVKRKRG